ncbi:MAG: efflux RND transporter periplasmic adaptor subunit, partial [Silvibacterium sp.]|nr:efflux RND transporter periplasmic adaptor subunit [Silvibacterium sp.]
VTQQDTDKFTTQQAATTTQVKSAQANVDRLEQLVGFESIYAPFDGTVTVRNVDIGTLIDIGTARELFHLADEHILRVYVNVPQPYSLACVPGVPATLTLAEFPGRSFEGKIVRTAKAIDLTSRTLLVEVDVPNPKGELYPGAYAQVHLKLKNEQPTLIIPVVALMFRSEGLRVGIIQGDKAKLVPITIGRDDGKAVEVVSGLKPSDQVIISPPDSLIDGETVRIVRQQNTGQPGQPAAPASQQGGK